MGKPLPVLSPPKRSRRWLKRLAFCVLALTVIVGVIFVTSNRFTNVSEDSLPHFIQANVVDPALVSSISKFRSGAGHSNAGWPETCRSMKHYITVYDPNQSVDPHFDRSQTPPDTFAIKVFSPVGGTLSKSSTGEGDDQLNISVDGQPGFSIRFEHVHLLPTLGRFFQHVTAGQEIATVWNSQNFDLSVYYHYFHGDELFSYFEVLPDNLFSAWQQQGITDRNELIFTKEYRDAHPLSCDTNSRLTPNFLDAQGNVTENWTAENIIRIKDGFDPSHPGKNAGISK